MVWLFLLFVVLPISELVLILQVGAWLGLWRTVGLIVITAVVGASMWRSQGLSILWSIRERIGRDETPGRELVAGMLVLIGGIFFLTPGFITDTLGFFCLIPWTRSLMLKSLRRWLERKIREGKLKVFVRDGHGNGSN